MTSLRLCTYSGIFAFSLRYSFVINLEPIGSFELYERN